MQSKDELLELTNKAKQQLKEQKTDVQEDIYGEFRSEFEEIANENIVIKENTSTTIANEEKNVKLRYEMTEDEYYEQEDIMNESSIANNEELLFPGGPTISEVDGWKKKYEGANVYATKILDEMFVFRTINRFEYKQLIRQVNIDASQREEIICETTVLFPYNYNWKVMAKKEGGIPSTLSQVIMQKSGFTDEYYIERL